SHEGGFNGSVAGAATILTGSAPGFVDAGNQDFRLLATSAAIDAGAAMHVDVLPIHNVVRHYVPHQSSSARPVNGSFDLGAFEFATAAPVQILTGTLPPAKRIRYYDQTVQASGGSGSYVWSVTGGTLPTGLRLDAASGAVRGRPRLKGIWSFTVTVTDSQNSSASQQYLVRVDPN
ncbi:MAG TPA: Ig domain-containing protein, partial [Pyrinomonadaceae bacterium]|nr:Ig domain-containing protein [Pyrinomonadaceae bacterium]